MLQKVSTRKIAIAFFILRSFVSHQKVDFIGGFREKISGGSLPDGSLHFSVHTITISEFYVKLHKIKYILYRIYTISPNLKFYLDEFVR